MSKYAGVLSHGTNEACKETAETAAQSSGKQKLPETAETDRQGLQTYLEPEKRLST